MLEQEAAEADETGNRMKPPQIKRHIIHAKPPLIRELRVKSEE
jgi:hypothetical protein